MLRISWHGQLKSVLLMSCELSNNGRNECSINRGCSEGLPRVRMGESLVLEKKLAYSENLQRGKKQLGCEKTAQ